MYDFCGLTVPPSCTRKSSLRWEPLVALVIVPTLTVRCIYRRERLPSEIMLQRYVSTDSSVLVNGHEYLV